VMLLFIPICDFYLILKNAGLVLFLFVWVLVIVVGDFSFFPLLFHLNSYESRGDMHALTRTRAYKRYNTCKNIFILYILCMRCVCEIASAV